MQTVQTVPLANCHHCSSKRQQPDAPFTVDSTAEGCMLRSMMLQRYLTLETSTVQSAGRPKNRIGFRALNTMIL